MITLVDKKQPSDKTLQDFFKKNGSLIWKNRAKTAGLALRGFLLALITLLITLTSMVIVFGKYFSDQLNIFTSASGMTTSEIKNTATTLYQQFKNPLKEPETILILGVDSLDTRPGSPALTDTILLATLNFAGGDISLLSVPRDLWAESQQIRINALYQHAKNLGEAKPENAVANYLIELTGIPISHSLVIEIDELSELVDLMGGVEVDVKEGFVDYQYPRGDVDVTKVTDPKLLYKTVEFKPGLQLLDGERSLEYSRSRKSLGPQGTDLARSLRQQQVIMAIVAKLQDYHQFFDLSYSGRLVKYYNQNFDHYLPLEILTHYLASFGKRTANLAFKNAVLSVYPEDKDGVLYHPNLNLYNGQWLFAVRDQTKLKEYVWEKQGLGKPPTGETSTTKDN